MGDVDKMEGTPENDILKSEAVMPMSESLSLSDVMQEAMPSEAATTVLTEGMSGPLERPGASADDGFQNIGSGPLKTEPPKPSQKGMPQPGKQP